MHELDQTQLRTAIGKVAASYDDADFFCAEARARLLERLELVTLVPRQLLELGAGTGKARSQLATIYPDARLLQLDWSLAMLRQSDTPHEQIICADSHRLPLADASVDIVVSNMMLPECSQPEAIFAEARRVLRPPGLFLFNTLGPDSFKQLRRAWAKVDNSAHVHVFADMHNVGDALVKAGFREPVLDVEMLTVTYAEIDGLIRDLRGVAGTNFRQERRRGLTTPRMWNNMLAALERSRDPEGRLPVGMEIVTGQAWVGEPDAGVHMEDGEARFPVSRLSGPRSYQG
jgi:malonyl-CoA O-methyltransferase